MSLAIDLEGALHQTPSIRPRVGSDALGVRYNMGRRGSVSAESLRPSSIASAEKIVIPKTYVLAGPSMPCRGDADLCAGRACVCVQR